jgi:tetratricopeptide (TPR) repeat protein
MRVFVNLATAALHLGLALFAFLAQDPVARARQLIDERKAAQAVEILRPVTTPESTDASAFNALGAALRQLRRFSDALAAYRRAEELNAASDEAVVGQAELHARLRQFPAAEQKYRRIIDRNSASIEARVGLAWVLSLQRKLDDALAEIEKALEVDPRHADARIRLGWIRLWRHERPEAQKAFEGVLQDRPGDVEAALGLSSVEAAQGRLYAAGAILETLARLHPANVDVLMALARIRARRGQVYAALEAVKRVGELQGDHVEALQLQGELAIREGRFAEGEAYYRRALQMEPEDMSARTGLATSLRRQGRRDEAREVYRSILQADPDHANARIGLGWEFTWEGDFPSASAEFERVLGLDPRNTDALAGLARVRHLQGRWAESQELYDRALASDPWDDAAIEGRAQIRRARESRVRLSFLHAEEFERDQVAELDALRLVTNTLTATWRKRLTPETAVDVEARMSLAREINRVVDEDNYDLRHLALIVGARHQVADHWTIGGRLGAGKFDDAGSGGTWSFDSGETFVEGSLWASADWDGHALALAASRSPLVIKDFPSRDLDVLTLRGVALTYESPWWKDGVTPEWHENRVEAALAYASYSDDNAKWGIDATFRHRWSYDTGWRLGPLVRLRASGFDEDVAFYYSYDRQVRLTAGAQVEYDPPGAWILGARYQATRSSTKERVNPGSHLFDPTLPIDETAKTVTTGGHAIDARATWLAGDAVRAGIDAAYSWDNDHYITWAFGLYVEAGF